MPVRPLPRIRACGRTAKPLQLKGLSVLLLQVSDSRALSLGIALELFIGATRESRGVSGRHRKAGLTIAAENDSLMPPAKRALLEALLHNSTQGYQVSLY